MKLYIGNATRQVYDFRYRAMDGGGPRGMGAIRFQKIDIAGQVRITGDLTREEIDHIIGQHAKYGLVHEGNIDQTRHFHGTCYAVDKPITAVRLSYLMESNLGVLVKRGEEIRKATAVAHSNSINARLADAGREPIPVLELTVQQENKDPTNDVPQMSEGILVSDDYDAQPLSGRGRRRAA